MHVFFIRRAVAFKMSGEKFDLTWDDFGSNVVNTIRNLLDDTQFTDVTLVSDDRKRIRAHKVILNSCSQFFKDILTETSSEDPLLFFKGIKHNELLAIVKFIYVGTTEIAQEDIGTFMKAAKDLEIEGLQEKKNGPELNGEYIHANSDYSGYDEMLPTYDDSVYEIENKNEKGQYVQEKDYKSDIPSNVGALQNVSFEKRSDGKYSCTECEYQAMHSHHLRRHHLAIHERVRFNCDQCDREFSTKTNLQTHKQAKHEGKKFICTDCDFEFSHPTNLSHHKAKTHKQ